MSISKETLVSRKEIMKGRVLHVTVDTVSIDDGQGGEKKTATREAVWHFGACAILPLTDDGKIILVRQYRYAAAEAMLEDTGRENRTRRRISGLLRRPGTRRRSRRNG